MSCDVSVIIPMYNTEKFIRQCVDSVLAQTLTNIEVIIVDDCTPDNSAALCEELYGNNKRVRIIHHEKNAGVGAARDTGTSQATGKYICYVDSDDEIMSDHLSNMFSIALEYDADVVHNTRFFVVTPKEGEALPLKMLDVPEEYLFSFSADEDERAEPTLLKYDLSSRLLDFENRRYHLSVLNGLYKTSFLRENDITFNKMRLAEDTIFYFQCLFNAKRFLLRPNGEYLYRVLNTSSSRGKNTPQRAVNAMRTQLEVVRNVLRISKKIPFFRDSASNTRRAIDTLILNLEKGFIRPIFQSLGEEAMRSDDVVHSFFVENFGGKAPYVEFLFYELHKNYEPVVDYIAASGDVETLKVMAKEMRGNEQQGKH